MIKELLKNKYKKTGGNLMKKFEGKTFKKADKKGLRNKGKEERVGLKKKEDVKTVGLKKRNESIKKKEVEAEEVEEVDEDDREIDIEEYIQELEDELENCVKENEELTAENEELKAELGAGVDEEDNEEAFIKYEINEKYFEFCESELLKEDYAGLDIEKALELLLKKYPEIVFTTKKLRTGMFHKKDVNKSDLKAKVAKQMGIVLK